MKKPFQFLVFFLCIGKIAIAQVGINSDNSTPHPSAQLDVKSSNKGLLLPRITSPAAAISSPTAGLMVYDQANANISYFNGANWSNINGSAGNQGLYSRFPNSRSFNSEFNYGGNSYLEYNFTVPSGINAVWIEMWAGGDRGEAISFATTTSYRTMQGGVGGDFGSFILPVVAGSTINLKVGKGGYTGGAGGFTTITYSGNTYEVRSLYDNILFNGSLITPLIGHIMFVAGQAGKVANPTIRQISSTNFMIEYKGGDGGDSYPVQKGGQGDYVTYSYPTGVYIATISGGNNNYGGRPGGGGGIGANSAGGPGFVILHW